MIGLHGDFAKKKYLNAARMKERDKNKFLGLSKPSGDSRREKLAYSLTSDGDAAGGAAVIHHPAIRRDDGSVRKPCLLVVLEFIFHNVQV